MDNPFERYDLDPREGIAAITRRLKELAEDAKDAAERERIREAWEELTLHPQRRLRAALFAHPETRSPLGMPQPLGRRRPAAAPEPTLRMIAPAPSVLVALEPVRGAEGRESSLEPSVSEANNESNKSHRPCDGPFSLDDDPALQARVPARR